jgi:hypothetical protein
MRSPAALIFASSFERGDVGHAGIHVHRAHRVADRLGLVDDLQLRLVVVEAARIDRLARRAPVSGPR